MLLVYKEIDLLTHPDSCTTYHINVFVCLHRTICLWTNNPMIHNGMQWCNNISDLICRRTFRLDIEQKHVLMNYVFSCCEVGWREMVCNFKFNTAGTFFLGITGKRSIKVTVLYVKPFFFLLKANLDHTSLSRRSRSNWTRTGLQMRLIARLRLK